MSRLGRAGLASAFLASAVVAWAPLVHGPGYEHALVLGLFFPTALALTGAKLVLAGSDGRGLLIVYAQVLLAALAGAVTPWLRFGACAPADDVGYELVTLGLGAALAMLWGVHAAHVRSDRRALLLAAAVPLASLGVSIAIFFATPTVHAFDAFAGYFAGPLYDTVLRLDGPFAAHRALVAGACLISLLAASPLVPVVRRELAAWCVLAVMAAIAPVGFRFGTWVTELRLAEVLSQRAEAGECVVHASGSLAPEIVQRIARDAAEQRRAIEELLGCEYPGQIDVFVFRDGAEKARLVGAADTLVAKPWRGEVYVQGTSYPHPVLGHELAHVIAGVVAPGPLRVPGRFGGLVANPGLVEGMAVAAAPHEDALTERAWSAAMARRGLLPPSAELFGLAFLGGNAARGYTAAGAFVAFVRETFGSGVLRSWYGGRDLPHLTSRSWGDLDASFRTWLLEATVSEREERVAAARFGAPGLAARACPHVVDGALVEAERCVRERRAQDALVALERARLLDPRSPAVRLFAASLEDRADRALAYETLAADEQLAASWRDEAATREADILWREGKGDQASGLYAGVLERTVDDARRRPLELKRAFALDPSTPEIVRAWLTPGVRRGEGEEDSYRLGVALQRWREVGDTPLRQAFRAQQAFLRDDCDDGLREAAAVDLAALPPAMARALVRGRLVCACLANDAERVQVARGALAAPLFSEVPGVHRALTALADRCSAANRERQKKSP